MTLWFLGLLFHVQHLIIIIEHHYSCALQLFYRWLLVAHDARGLLLVGVIDKLLETEVEDVVGGDDEEIWSPLLSSPLGEGIENNSLSPLRRRVLVKGQRSKV